MYKATLYKEEQSSSYVQEISQMIKRKYPWEREYIQAVDELLSSLSLLFDQEPLYQHERILERIVEPERIVIFRVPWRDDTGTIQVNTGYRIGFNSALGPYKGGLRFHASVSLSILKFLGFSTVRTAEVSVGQIVSRIAGQIVSRTHERTREWARHEPCSLQPPAVSC